METINCLSNVKFLLRIQHFSNKILEFCFPPIYLYAHYLDWSRCLHVLLPSCRFRQQVYKHLFHSPKLHIGLRLCIDFWFSRRWLMACLNNYFGSQMIFIEIESVPKFHLRCQSGCALDKWLPTLFLQSLEPWTVLAQN